MSTKKLTPDHKKWFCEFYPDFRKSIDILLLSSPNFFLRVALLSVRAAGATLSEMLCDTTKDL